MGGKIELWEVKGAIITLLEKEKKNTSKVTTWDKTARSMQIEAIHIFDDNKTQHAIFGIGSFEKQILDCDIVEDVNKVFFLYKTTEQVAIQTISDKGTFMGFLIGNKIIKEVSEILSSRTNKGIYQPACYNIYSKDRGVLILRKNKPAYYHDLRHDINSDKSCFIDFKPTPQSTLLAKKQKHPHSIRNFLAYVPENK